MIFFKMWFAKIANNKSFLFMQEVKESILGGELGPEYKGPS